jgi:hypothetical protein
VDLSGLADSIPAAITAFAGIVTACVATVVKVAKVWRAVQDARMQSVPPVAPQPVPREPTNPFGHAPLTDPSISARVLEANIAVHRAEAYVADERERTRQALARAEQEREEVAQDARRTAAALTAAQLQLDAARAKQATSEASAAHWRGEAERLQRERDQAEGRASAAVRELRAHKGEATGAHSTGPETAITPLRPPRPTR